MGPDPNDWSFKKRTCGRSQAQREDHVKTQEKRATYKPRRANAGLRLPASRAVKKQIFAV